MLRLQSPPSTISRSSLWTDPPHPCVPMVPLCREVPISTPFFYTKVPGRLALCQAPQRRVIPTPCALLPLSVPVTLHLMSIALILSWGHSYKVPWNWKPSLWLTKLCSMQQAVDSTSYDTHGQALPKYNSTHITWHASTSPVFNIGTYKVL